MRIRHVFRLFESADIELRSFRKLRHINNTLEAHVLDYSDDVAKSAGECLRFDAVKVFQRLNKKGKLFVNW